MRPTGGSTQPAAGAASHPAMPHGRAGWSGLWLRTMRAPALQLSFVRQPALPKVPWPTKRTLAATTAGAAATLSVLPADLHAAGRTARPGPLRAETGLWRP